MRILFILLACGILYGEDHFVLESKRTYMGRTRPPVRIETWIGQDRVSTSNGRMLTLTRYDLSKKWTIHLAKKRYVEESIQPSKPKDPEPVRIQEVGHDYVPSYTWSQAGKAVAEVVDGQNCQRIVLEGEADYASEKREIWVAKDVKVDANRYFRCVIQENESPEYAAAYQKHVLPGLPIKTLVVLEGPIAPTVTIESRMVKAEQAPAPAGIFELPKDLQKVDSFDERFQ